MIVTFNGIDTFDLSVLDILLDFPNVEPAVLLTYHPENRPRCPSLEVIKSILSYRPNRVALHVCGSAARNDILQPSMRALVSLASRVQLNGWPERYHVEAICEAYPGTEFITQHTYRNLELLDVSAPNHSLLVDRSGGRGISPETWTRPETSKRVGFAGGLGPHNVAFELERIKAVATEPFWIDMEQKLRDGKDRFDASRCIDVLKALKLCDFPE